MRDGMYWSGDLGYADPAGSAGSPDGRVSGCGSTGENSAPLGGAALLRHSAIAEAAVYGVPDPVAATRSWPASCCAAERR